MTAKDRLNTITMIENMEAQMKAFHAALENNFFPGIRKVGPEKMELDVPTCRKCGCTEFTPCYDDETGTCWWVEDDLCSACATAKQKSNAIARMKKQVPLK